MRIRISKNVMSYDFGIFLANWGYPIAHQWEIGIHFFKWSIGVELYK